MSIQTIINYSQKININRRKVVGIQYSRDETPRISETPTKNPWRITITPNSNLVYSEARQVLEAIDVLDRYKPEIIKFNDNPKLSWIFRYQGDLVDSQLSAIRVGSFANSGNFLTLINLPQVDTTVTIFRPGDLIQIVGSPYPFTIIKSYTGANLVGSTLTVETHRPNFLSVNVNNAALNFGSNCEFRVFCPNMPTYSLLPGAPRYDNLGNLINHAYIEWEDDFQLYEYLGTA